MESKFWFFYVTMETIQVSSSNSDSELEEPQTKKKKFDFKNSAGALIAELKNLCSKYVASGRISNVPTLAIRSKKVVIRRSDDRKCEINHIVCNFRCIRIMKILRSSTSNRCILVEVRKPSLIQMSEIH